MEKLSTVQEAVEFLNAQAAPAPHVADYIYWSEETSEYYVVSESDLEALVELSNHGDEQVAGDAYSHWCASYGDLASDGRYEVRWMGRGRGGQGETNADLLGHLIVATDSLKAAREFAEAHAMSSDGTVIVDTEKNRADFGNGWEALDAPANPDAE